MPITAELHLHTALSPCADDDMTPNNIANMAVLCGLDVIAVTDHNSAKNAAAVIEAAKNTGASLTVIPGMEAESAEEVHIICLFPDIERAMAFDAWIEAGMSGIKNKPDIFGRQLIMDANDGVTGEYGPLLVTATRYGIDEIIAKAKALGGVAYPAHADRDANGVISVLGFIPPELDIAFIELSGRCDPEAFVKTVPGLDKYGVIRASDAHRLHEIGTHTQTLHIDGEASVNTILNYLRGSQ